ncbi:RagB/SusD family nutrient uptake outer membrane protein [Sphingobacterium sp. JUb56]|uniref:RagB/SusD family nutrient uptake outer membrane protein n=1 Tax=Sphingobacterium sp. JUb56 TaxID=2587145 RepID=UPI00162057BB|nr:RagB/SusD family nutrient uptake outer membrane protein [Sphingobacterium sp. JUb56]MBB2950380.1 hypothetical protein [Sphingobacterium sp. JUb56]
MKPHKQLNKYHKMMMFVCVVLTGSCSKDFLNRDPLTSVNSTNFFKTASDLQIYTNGLYSKLAPQYNTMGGSGSVSGGNSNLGLDLNTDVMIMQTSVTASLNRWSTASTAPDVNSTWDNGYVGLRNDNYFLHYANLNAEKTDAAKHYIGEGYFFRAWDYFNLLQNFGGVPIVNELLTEQDTDKLYKPRSSRYEVAKQIISDIDSAIDRLHWKGEGQAAMAGRLNKEAALNLKARVALYEGTWEYYHNKKGTPFAMTGQDGVEFLKLIEPTVNILLNRHGSRIFTMAGDKEMAYNQLFSQKDASNIDGVFLYKVYDASKLAYSHNFFFKIKDFGHSITNHLVDIYLRKDGTPQPLGQNYTPSLNDLGNNLDPRFKQTVWTPDRGPQNKLTGRGGDGDPFRYPFIAHQAPYTEGFTSTGYRNFKGAVFAQEATKGETDDILMRYEESLLALAEAKAILGSITQSDLDKTINVMRARVGMLPMQMNAGVGTNYNEEYGFDKSESALVNEVRRERMVELALEGYRLNDLKRWAVYEKVINGYQPKGALLQEYLDYYNRTPEQFSLDQGNNPALYSQIRKDGYVVEKYENSFKLTVGSNVSRFPDGRINPWFKVADFLSGGRGLYIDKNRDYLNGIPLKQIMLYQVNGGTLGQNPGWN